MVLCVYKNLSSLVHYLLCPLHACWLQSLLLLKSGYLRFSICLNIVFKWWLCMVVDDIECSREAFSRVWPIVAQFHHDLQSHLLYDVSFYWNQLNKCIRIDLPISIKIWSNLILLISLIFVFHRYSSTSWYTLSSTGGSSFWSSASWMIFSSCHFIILDEALLKLTYEIKCYSSFEIWICKHLLIDNASTSHSCPPGMEQMYLHCIFLYDRFTFLCKSHHCVCLTPFTWRIC